MDKILSMSTIELLITFLTSMIASSGFWLFLDKKNTTRDLSKRLLIGLAHDRIICLSMQYIDRGSITKDEYENLCEFLYLPYLAMGGNGSVKRLMAEVDKLPILQSNIFDRPKGDN
jgi:hypothetical protein